MCWGPKFSAFSSKGLFKIFLGSSLDTGQAAKQKLPAKQAINADHGNAFVYVLELNDLCHLVTLIFLVVRSLSLPLLYTLKIHVESDC